MIYLVNSAWHRRAVRLLAPLFAAAVLVSVVHYVDNTVNYGDYPRGGPLPDPSRWLIGAAWLFFTAAGAAGYVLFRREPTSLALALLAVFSGSGLVGFGHYAVPGAFDMPAWRQAHVITDILLGIAMLAFVMWSARSRVPTPRRG